MPCPGRCRTTLNELGLVAELAHPHVVEHALTERTDGMGRGGHRGLLSWDEADCLIPQARLCAPQPPSLPTTPGLGTPTAVAV